MNKQELVEKVKGELTYKDAEQIVNNIFSTIKTAVAEGDSVQIIGFGTFITKERAARNARNPQTGETIKIAAKKAPAFKAGKAFKEAVNA